MPVIESVVASGNVDRRTDNLIRAFTKPSVLRVPVTSCPEYTNPLHWADNGLIITYDELIDNTDDIIGGGIEISAFVTAKGFGDLTELNEGLYGIGFYTVENEVLNIVSPVPFVNNNILNFCVDTSISFEYDNFIVYTNYEILPGLIPTTIQNAQKLKDVAGNFTGTPDMTPDQVNSIRHIAAIMSSNSVFDMRAIPPEYANLPGFNSTLEDFYRLPDNVEPIEYIDVLASAIPPLILTMDTKQLWTCDGLQDSDFVNLTFDPYPITYNTMQYYGCKIEETTGGAMPPGGKGLGGHTNDLLAALPGILSALSARNGLLDYLGMLGGLCAAFAQAIGTILGVINGIMAAINQVILDILGLIDSLINFTAAVVELIVNQIAALVGQLMALVQQVISKIMDEIAKIVQFFLDLINQALASIFGLLDDCLVGLITQVGVPAATDAIGKNIDISKLGIF